MNVLKDKEVFILHTASYLYAMQQMKTNSESKTPTQYMESFVNTYLDLATYKDSIDDQCADSFNLNVVNKCLHLAEVMLDLNVFDMFTNAHYECIK